MQSSASERDSPCREMALGSALVALAWSREAFVAGHLLCAHWTCEFAPFKVRRGSLLLPCTCDGRAVGRQLSEPMMPLKLAELDAHRGCYSALLRPIPLKLWCSTAAWVPMARPTQRLTRGSAFWQPFVALHA
jgi:hypothetical protein